MMRPMIAVALMLAPVAASAQEAPLAWLSGEWCSEGAGSCERWGPMAGGTMLATSQTVKGGRTVAFEFLRVTMEGGTAVYHAQPGGRPAVAFRETKRDATSITFENPAHDYPQRIRYAREGDALTAEISLADGSKPMRWRFQRLR